MRELVPSLKMPPLFTPELAAVETETATAIAIAARVMVVSRRLVISCLLDLYVRNTGSSPVSVRWSASSVQRTPSGSDARCFPWPSGSL